MFWSNDIRRTILWARVDDLPPDLRAMVHGYLYAPGGDDSGQEDSGEELDDFDDWGVTGFEDDFSLCDFE